VRISGHNPEKLTTEITEPTEAQTGGALRGLRDLCGEALVLSRTELEP